MKSEFKISVILKFLLAAALLFLYQQGCKMENPSGCKNGTNAKNSSIDQLIGYAEKLKLKKNNELYWWQIFRILDRISDKEILPCVSKKKNPSDQYRYVIEIGSGGKITNIHWDRSDGFTKCIDTLLLKEKYPDPPETPFYFYLTGI